MMDMLISLWAFRRKSALLDSADHCAVTESLIACCARRIGVRGKYAVMPVHRYRMKYQLCALLLTLVNGSMQSRRKLYLDISRILFLVRLFLLRCLPFYTDRSPGCGNSAIRGFNTAPK